ncbi:abc transporter a family member 1-related [Anaeramoeba flamelloides]|uniref:Abc transporter a family member 1-related n=1 Tax=Anaeramoeba flamelloides TaxID=1746091 RepID=A0AAV7Z483_9EUKA|nr:abc transporter a family member 1-related [Anaeramoeba flamelloides]
MRTRFRQTGNQLRKNWKISIRNKKTTSCALLLPLLFNISLLLIKLAIESNPSESNQDKLSQPRESPVFPRCNKKFDLKCNTLAYNGHGNKQVESVISRLLTYSDTPRNEVHGERTETNLDTYFYQNPNKTLFGIVFRFDQTEYTDTIPEDARFFIQVNESTLYNKIAYDDFYDIFCPVQILLQRALFEVVGEFNINIDVQFSKFPHPKLVTIDTAGALGKTFFFWALLFNMIIMAGQIVQEKESRKRFGMKMMGLTDFSYWTSWILTDLLIIFIVILVLIITGSICGFEFFLKNDFSIYFVLFLLFGLNVVATATFISTLVEKTKSATMIGFALFCIFTIFNGLASVLIYNEDVSKIYRIIFSLLSPVVFTKALNDLSIASGYDGSTGMRWSSISNNAEIFPMRTCFNWLVLDFFIVFFLTFYFDNVLSKGIGVKKTLFYFLKPSYWKGKANKNENEILVDLKNAEEENSKLRAMDLKNQKKKKNDKGQEQEQEKEKERVEGGAQNEDLDVRNERKKLLDSSETESTIVKIYGLTKVFKKNIVRSTIKDFKAVDNLYLTMQDDQLIALLGPNGSGKTTTINMLTGLLPPTGGFASIDGYSIISEIGTIRERIGVCPQHDILWDELTAREHIKIFAGLKNIPKQQIPLEIEDRLAEVDLIDVGNQRVGSFSGGMKRRLSVAIALTGNSKVILLDEPTTGMDPVARRHVWNIIQNAKKKRVILLTTHSMEEADILSDKIAIIAAGKLRCVGSSLHLKNKFGAGYRITMIIEEGTLNEIKEIIKEKLSNVLFVSESLVTLTIEIPRSNTHDLPEFFEFLDLNKDELFISDYSVSMTTLEEVFLNIAKSAANERYNELKEKLKGDLLAQKEIEKKKNQFDIHYENLNYHSQLNYQNEDDDVDESSNPKKKKVLKKKIQINEKKNKVKKKIKRNSKKNIKNNLKKKKKIKKKKKNIVKKKNKEIILSENDISSENELGIQLDAIIDKDLIKPDLINFESD